MKKLFYLLLLAPLLGLAQPTPPGGAPPASQAEVNAGLISNKYVSPKTLAGWTGGGGGGTPGGVDGDFQYNDNGNFGGYTLVEMTALIFGQTITTINATTVNVSALQPATNDGAALGSTSNQFSDLFLAEGAVINWDNGDATITQAGNAVTLAGAVFAGDIGTSTATTASAGTSSTVVATTAFTVAASKATRLWSHASTDTTGGAITWTNAVYEVFTNTTTEYDLPAAAGYDGTAVIFYVTGTNAITIDPNGSEVIVRSGTVQTGGVTMTLAGVAGNYVCLLCDGTRWITLGSNGTLAAGS